MKKRRHFGMDTNKRRSSNRSLRGKLVGVTQTILRELQLLHRL